MVFTFSRLSRTTESWANIPGRRRPSWSSGRTLTVKVRLRTSPLGKTLVTRPLNCSPGKALTPKVAGAPSWKRAMLASSTLRAISTSREMTVIRGVLVETTEPTVTARSETMPSKGAVTKASARLASWMASAACCCSTAAWAWATPASAAWRSWSVNCRRRPARVASAWATPARAVSTSKEVGVLSLSRLAMAVSRPACSWAMLAGSGVLALSRLAWAWTTACRAFSRSKGVTLRSLSRLLCAWSRVAWAAARSAAVGGAGFTTRS